MKHLFHEYTQCSLYICIYIGGDRFGGGDRGGDRGDRPPMDRDGPRGIGGGDRFGGGMCACVCMCPRAIEMRTGQIW